LAAFSSLLVTCVDIVHLLFKSFIRFWCQPIADLMWLKITLFLKASPHVGRRCGLLCLAS
jgi:hypothetical protein